MKRKKTQKPGNGYLQTAVVGESGRPRVERVRGHVLLQAGLLRRVSGDPRRVPAGFPGQCCRHEPQSEIIQERVCVCTGGGWPMFYDTRREHAT